MKEAKFCDDRERNVIRYLISTHIVQDANVGLPPRCRLIPISLFAAKSDSKIRQQAGAGRGESVRECQKHSQSKLTDRCLQA